MVKTIECGSTLPQMTRGCNRGNAWLMTAQIIASCRSQTRTRVVFWISQDLSVAKPSSCSISSCCARYCVLIFYSILCKYSQKLEQRSIVLIDIPAQFSDLSPSKALSHSTRSLLPCTEPHSFEGFSRAGQEDEREKQFFFFCIEFIVQHVAQGVTTRLCTWETEYIRRAAVLVRVSAPSTSGKR